MAQRRSCSFGIFCPFVGCHNKHTHATNVAVATRVASDLYPLEFVQELERFHAEFPNARDGLACYADKARRDYVARVAPRHHDFYVARQVALSVLHTHVEDPRLYSAICTTVVEAQGDVTPTKVATRNRIALRGATELAMRPSSRPAPAAQDGDKTVSGGRRGVPPLSSTVATTVTVTTTHPTTNTAPSTQCHSTATATATTGLFTTATPTAPTTALRECMHCFDDLTDVAYVIQHADGRTACGMWCHACHLLEGYAHKEACPRCNGAVHAVRKWQAVRLDCAHVHADVCADWRAALARRRTQTEKEAGGGGVRVFC